MREPRIVRGALLVLLATLTTAPSASAGAPSVHALTGARVVVGPGQVIETATVVLRDGVIEAVGADVEPPPDARVWERDELTIYPGLIESYNERSWPDEEGDDAPGGGHRNALVRPEREMTAHAADEAAAKKLRGAGFTTAVVAPKQGLFRGRSVVMNLGEGSINDNLLRTGVAQNVSFARNGFGDGYPSSLMGTIALFRQTLLDAGWYAKAQAAYGSNPAQTRPAANTALAALGPVASGDEIVVFETDDVRDSLAASRLVDEFGLDAMLVGSGEEYRWLDAVAATGMPVLLPLDHPDVPEVGDEDDLSLGLDTLRHWDESPRNPGRLLDAGVQVAFTSHGHDDPKKLLTQVHQSIEAGLDSDAALAALTTTPARLFGVADRAGTVEAGKMANLVVVEGDLFAKKPKIREVWIDGKRYEIQESKPAQFEPAGTWNLTVVTGDGQEMTAVLEIIGKVPDLSGVLSMGAGMELPLASVEVSGATLRISFDGTPLGMPGSIDFEMDVEGDSAAGSGTSPPGPFSVKATRIAKPEPEEDR